MCCLKFVYNSDDPIDTLNIKNIISNNFFFTAKINQGMIDLKNDYRSNLKPGILG